MDLSKHSKFLPLNPIIVNNLIIIEGRIGQLYLYFEQKHQIYRTKEHFLPALLLDKHERNCPIGREQTLPLLQESVRIIKGKALVRKFKQNCSFCKRRQILLQLPIMNNLPEAGLAINEPPFTNTGLDYFGPLTIKHGSRTRSTGGPSKRYGAIFTCLSPCAVHIELGNNLSTSNFTLALRRLISRRGHPKNIFSDNGTNFTRAQRELAKSGKCLDQDRIGKELTLQKINWIFSPPVSPCMNGAMKAIVKITKKHLNTITRNHLFNDETLCTYLTEIESIINGRPLTHLSDDINDFVVLTPNH